MSILLFAGAGCETKSQARLEAQRAFLAGQQQAGEQAHSKPAFITVKGRVVNPIIPWTEGLTLAKAVNAAEYTGYLNPRLIRLVRDGLTTEIKPSALLTGQDLAVQAGDTIEIVQ